VLALSAASALTACDRLPEAVILPEFEFSYSFDNGLSGWTARATDMGTGSWSATEESGAVRLELVNDDGAGKVWLTHGVEVTPFKLYTVDISLDLATADYDAMTSWRVIAGARATDPTLAADLTFQDGTAASAPAGERAWVARQYSVTASADKEGRLYLMLGIWGTTTGTRSYLVDNVKVVLTRVE